jgi:hypothetical protein
VTRWPDQETHALPTRAYLRSVLEQTMPARRTSLADSIEHFHWARESDARGWIDMAFLGVIADALQALEDLAYVGESFTVNRFHGLPFYVGAITYSASVPTTFYTRKRTHDDFRVLAGYAVRDPQSGALVGVLDQMIGVTPALRAAWDKAEEGTIGVLQGAIAELAETWRRFGKHFHAFKHGGLVTHRPDLEILDADGNLVDPAVAVWTRKKNEPHVAGDTDATLDIDAVAATLELHAQIAFDVLHVVVATRLGMAEQATQGPTPSGQEIMRVTVPVRFRVRPDALGADERRELEAVGIRFDDAPGSR